MRFVSLTFNEIEIINHHVDFSPVAKVCVLVRLQLNTFPDRVAFLQTTSSNKKNTHSMNISSELAN